MKYALIPVLTEVHQFFEEYGVEDADLDECLQLPDPYGLMHEEMLTLLHKVHQANRGKSND